MGMLATVINGMDYKATGRKGMKTAYKQRHENGIHSRIILKSRSSSGKGKNRNLWSRNQNPQRILQRFYVVTKK
jgi:hypothetical protein